METTLSGTRVGTDREDEITVKDSCIPSMLHSAVRYFLAGDQHPSCLSACLLGVYAHSFPSHRRHLHYSPIISQMTMTDFFPPQCKLVPELMKMVVEEYVRGFRDRRDVKMSLRAILEPHALGVSMVGPTSLQSVFLVCRLNFGI